jgi:hypothetical protein
VNCNRLAAISWGHERFALEHKTVQISLLNSYDYSDAFSVTVNHFKSDGCVQIIRENKNSRTHDATWMFGPGAHSDRFRSRLDLPIFERQSSARYEPGCNDTLTQTSRGRSATTPFILASRVNHSSCSEVNQLINVSGKMLESSPWSMVPTGGTNRSMSR